MAFTQTHEYTIDGGGSSVYQKSTFTSGGRADIDESIADGVTDGLLAYVLDVTQIVAFVIVSTQDILVETNSSSAPDDSLSLIANEPQIWDEDSLATNFLTTDITALYVTNASGSAATLKIRCLFDPTV